MKKGTIGLSLLIIGIILFIYGLANVTVLEAVSGGIDTFAEVSTIVGFFIIIISFFILKNLLLKWIWH